MNIFMTSSCPQESAKFLDDKRVVKMVLESAQLLSTVLGGPYKPTHTNHPCTRWVSASRANARWILRHMISLCREYTYRYGKTHKCQALIPGFRAQLGILEDRGLTPPVNCTTYKEHQDVYLAYQLYINDKWETDKRVPTWYGVPSLGH